MLSTKLKESSGASTNYVYLTMNDVLKNSGGGGGGANGIQELAKAPSIPPPPPK